MRSAIKLGMITMAVIWSATSVTAQNTRSSSGCKIVHLKAGENPPSGAMTSSVTAGGGKVSGTTTGGNSVTVHSGNGTTTSSIATAGSSGGSATTTVTTGDGQCTTYIQDKK